MCGAVHVAVVAAFQIICSTTCFLQGTYSCIQIGEIVFILFLVNANFEITNILQLGKWSFQIKRMEITAYQSKLYSLITGRKIVTAMLRKHHRSINMCLFFL
jgi:uncharacterized membrane protein